MSIQNAIQLPKYEDNSVYVIKKNGFGSGPLLIFTGFSPPFNKIIFNVCQEEVNAYCLEIYYGNTSSPRIAKLGSTGKNTCVFCSINANDIKTAQETNNCYIMIKPASEYSFDLRSCKSFFDDEKMDQPHIIESYQNFAKAFICYPERFLPFQNNDDKYELISIWRDNYINDKSDSDDFFSNFLHILEIIFSKSLSDNLFNENIFQNNQRDQIFKIKGNDKGIAFCSLVNKDFGSIYRQILALPNSKEIILQNYCFCSSPSPSSPPKIAKSLKKNIRNKMPSEFIDVLLKEKSKSTEWKKVKTEEIILSYPIIGNTFIPYPVSFFIPAADLYVIPKKGENEPSFDPKYGSGSNTLSLLDLPNQSNETKPVLIDGKTDPIYHIIKSGKKPCNPKQIPLEMVNIKDSGFSEIQIRPK